MQPIIFSIFIAFILIHWSFADYGDEDDIQFRSKEMIDFMKKEPQAGYLMMKITKDMRVRELKFTLKEKALEIEKYKKLYDDANRPVYRCTCIANVLGRLSETLGSFWKAPLDYDKKFDEDFYVSQNYHDCFAFFTGSTDTRIDREILDKLRCTKEENSDIFNTRIDSETSVNATLDNPETKYKRDEIRSMIKESDFTVHDYCYMYWKTWKIRSAFVRKLTDKLDFAYRYNGTLHQVECPKFIHRRLEFTEADVPILNFMLDTVGFMIRIFMKNETISVSVCE